MGDPIVDVFLCHSENKPPVLICTLLTGLSSKEGTYQKSGVFHFMHYAFFYDHIRHRIRQELCRMRGWKDPGIDQNLGEQEEHSVMLFRKLRRGLFGIRFCNLLYAV